jgi:4a-hydroxytetrahydrobiopterin dehydratase
MAATLTPEQITAALKDLRGWTYEPSGSAGKLVCTYTFKHFKEAMSFLVRVGFEAEAMNHHPEIHNVYRTVTLSLSTHDAGNKVTQKDVDLARAIQHLSWV